MSSKTTTSGRSAASASTSLRTAQKISGGVTALAEADRTRDPVGDELGIRVLAEQARDPLERVGGAELGLDRRRRSGRPRRAAST